MRKPIKWLALPAIATAIAFAQPASAAVVTYTYTGHVDAGVDQIGLFGGGRLDGLSFTAVFSRDDALADDLYVGPGYSLVHGPEAVTAKLTIGGVTLDVGGADGQQSQYDDGSLEGFFHYAAGAFGGFSLGGQTLGTFAPTPGDVLASSDYHTLASLTASDTPGFAWFGRFDFGAADPTDPDRGLFTNGQFIPTALVVTPGPDGAAGVPEPTSWALMIAGFGLAGACLRRRREVVFA